MVRLAVVGIGGYGGRLVQLIRSVGEERPCRLVAVADNRMAELGDKAREIAGPGVELFDDAVRMFDEIRDRCDGVYIATGIASHEPLTIAAAKRGYQIHLEKPAAATVQEVDAMIRAVQAGGKYCMVGFQALHSKTLHLAKEELLSGRLGTVRTLICRACWPRTRSYFSRNDWAARLRSGRRWVLDGPATNALAHQIMNLLFLAGAEQAQCATPSAVRAELYAAGGSESHNTAAIEIRTVEGPTAYFIASHCTQDRFNPLIEVQADRGRLWRGYDGLLEVSRGDGTCESFDEASSDVYREIVVDFVEAIQRGDRSLLRCELAHARQMTLALDGAHESSGCVHPIDERFTRVVDAGTDRERIVVDGMDDYLRRAAAEGKLLADLDDPPPWAVAGVEYDLTGYTSFPQRFRCEAE